MGSSLPVMSALHPLLDNPHPFGLDLAGGLTIGVGISLFIIAIILAFMGRKP